MWISKLFCLLLPVCKKKKALIHLKGSLMKAPSDKELNSCFDSLLSKYDTLWVAVLQAELCMQKIVCPLRIQCTEEWLVSSFSIKVVSGTLVALFTSLPKSKHWMSVGWHLSYHTSSIMQVISDLSDSVSCQIEVLESFENSHTHSTSSKRWPQL